MEFVKNVTKSLDISTAQTRVAMAQFSTFSQVEFDFQFQKKPLYKAIENVQYLAGSTFTGAAIQFVVDNLFSKVRQDAKPVLIVLTDGISYDDVRRPSNFLKRELKGHIFTIGVGNAVRFQLRQIASQPSVEYMWKDRDWGLLNRIYDELTLRMCEL